MIDVIAIAATFLAITAPHELGHMIVGRLFGIRPSEFRIGVGPSVHRRIRGTRYSVGAIPILAYVRFSDICHVSPVRRIAMYVAGPVASILASGVCLVVAATLITDSVVRGFQFAIRAFADVWAILTSNYIEFIDPRSFVGPIGIGHMVATSSADLTSWLIVVAAISLGLGLFNLLPILPLDGGWILTLMIEAIARRPLPRLVARFAILGGAVIVGAMLYASYNDVLRIIR